MAFVNLRINMCFQKKALLFSLFFILIVSQSPLYAAKNITGNSGKKSATKNVNKKSATQSTDTNKKPATHQGSTGWLNSVMPLSGKAGKFNPDKGIDFSVVIGPYYSPEVSLGLAGAVVGLYQADVQSELSSLVIQGVGSINGSYALNIQNDVFLNRNSRQFYVYLSGLAMDVVYYGKGYQENIKDDNLVEYHSDAFTFVPRWKERLYGNIFVGIGADFSYSKAADITKNRRSVVDTTSLKDPSRSVGVTSLINYDTRDHVLNATKGLSLEFDVSLFDDALGSDKNFTLQNFSYSQYLPVNNTDVLAWQFIGKFSNGDVPWDRMPSLGGISGLRGYNSGRYQDDQMMMTQVEYRLHLIRRHGMVFWLGVGALADNVSQFKTDELLPSAGVGYRYLIKENVNMRFDVGYGRNGPNVYLSVNNAF